MDRFHLAAVTLLLGCALGSCRSERGASCSNDGMCADGLVCHEQRCELPEAIAVAKERRRQTEAAVAGYHELLSGCAAAFKVQEALAQDDDHLAELIQRQGTPGVAADEWVDVEVDEAIYLAMLDHVAMYQDAHLEACRVCVPLYEENPVFREAVRKALRAALPAAEPGPSMPSEIAFCSPELQGPMEHYLEEAAVECGIDTFSRSLRAR